ncbi:endophilin b [Nesidiocoris tenuis]|uniref:Endophilin b n=1 Tax=Nesidiocoris tenuis TaxID=355587 RepID=A0ABN7A972_9HEMI|nr:endophilin b [Nesidiocoris tenuis]
MYNRSKSTRFQPSARSSFNVLNGETLAQNKKMKTDLPNDFEELFNKINNLRDWTKNLINDSCSIVDLEPNMNVTKYLEDSNKRHLRRSNLEILGVDMMSAAKHSGIKGSIYEKALLKVGDCERKLGTYNRDFVIDVCSSFIRPLRHFLDVDVNKLLEEKEMLTSRKIDYDYYAKSYNGKKEDRSAHHKFKMAEMALEFQYIHAKEILESIEASECQVGHLRDLVNVQALYHKKCFDELEQLQQQLQRMSSTSVTASKVPLKRVSESHNRNRSEHVAGDGRTVSSARFTIRCERHSPNRGYPDKIDQVNLGESKGVAEGDNPVRSCRVDSTGQENPKIQDREQGVAHTAHASSCQCKACPPTSPHCSRYPTQNRSRSVSPHHQHTKVISSINVSPKCISHREAPEKPNVSSAQEQSESGKNFPSRASSKTNLLTTSTSHKPSTSSPFSVEPIVTEQNDESVSESTSSKETHFIPIPLRGDYRRSVGQIFFKPRDEIA